MDTTTGTGNQSMAIVGGLAAALVGAAIWAVITVITGYQIGFMALGVGILVGLAVRTLGKGSTVQFRVIGVAFALIGCLLGNLLSICGILAKEEEIAVMRAVSGVFGDPGLAAHLLKTTFSAIDLLFYAIAAYEGWKLSVASPATPAAA